MINALILVALFKVDDCVFRNDNPKDHEEEHYHLITKIDKLEYTFKYKGHETGTLLELTMRIKDMDENFYLVNCPRWFK